MPIWTLVVPTTEIDARDRRRARHEQHVDALGGIWQRMVGDLGIDKSADVFVDYGRGGHVRERNVLMRSCPDAIVFADGEPIVRADDPIAEFLNVAIDRSICVR